MTNDSENRQHVFKSENVSGRDPEGSTLVPMLIAGLVLIAIGAVALMFFV